MENLFGNSRILSMETSEGFGFVFDVPSTNVEDLKSKFQALNKDGSLVLERLTDSLPELKQSFFVNARVSSQNSG